MTVALIVFFFAVIGLLFVVTLIVCALHGLLKGG